MPGVPSGGLPTEGLERLSSWPAEVARSDLAAYFTWSLEDRRWLRSHRGAVDYYDLVVSDHLRAGTDKVVAYLDGGRGHLRDDGARSGSAREDEDW